MPEWVQSAWRKPTTKMARPADHVVGLWTGSWRRSREGSRWERRDGESGCDQRILVVVEEVSVEDSNPRYRFEFDHLVGREERRGQAR